jgi:hypothetical protein
MSFQATVHAQQHSFRRLLISGWSSLAKKDDGHIGQFLYFR